MPSPAILRFHVDPPVDLRATLGPLALGPRDPTVRVEPGAVWRTTTAGGGATARFTADGAMVTVEAWGEGAEEMLAAGAATVGMRDDPASFVPLHDVVADLVRRHPGLRIPATGAVFEALVPTVLSQKVTIVEAAESWRRLVMRLGEPAPGPAPAGMRLPPRPTALAAAPLWLYHRAGIERRRADVVRRAAARAQRVEEASAMPMAAAYDRLLAFPGVGPWTAAEVAVRALGDADAVCVGDFHVPHLVSRVLADERRGSDARMLELLSPYAGHRARVIRLVRLGAPREPRRAPRERLRSIAAI